MMNQLYIVATPIGNLNDISIRALQTLFSADIIACEDTRRTGQLIYNYQLRIKNKEWILKNLYINPARKYVSYYDQVEEIKSRELIDYIHQGKKVVLVSDAGSPLIADPGYKLVKECGKLQIKVIAIPGPSALI